MKTAISLPDPVFEEAESLAKQLGVSRSQLYTQALKAYLKHHNHDRRLNQLNAVYADQSSAPDPVLTKLQMMSLPREDW